MKKASKYAINGLFIGGIGNALLNTIMQLIKMNDKTQEKFNWEELWISAGKGALVGGTTGLVIGALQDHQNSNEKPINTDSILKNIVNDIKLDKNDRIYKSLCHHADYLIKILNQKFFDKLDGDLMKIGSTEKGTALHDKFDIDVCIPFKPGSFSSTEEMYYTVLKFLEQHIGINSIVKIRDQKKSVGVIIEIGGVQYKIDVVPFKLTNPNSTSGYLYVNNKTLFIDNSSYTKTDVHALKNIKLTGVQKEIVIALKNWKTKNDIPISSHLLEHLVLDTYKFNRYNIHRSFTKKIIMVLEHIKNNLDSTVIRSIENTNNILTAFSDEKKNEIIGACKKAIEDYEYQPNSIIKTLK